MNIIITGSSRGIGYETVKFLAMDLKNNIFATARSSDGLEKLKMECTEIHKEAVIHIFPFDLINGNYEELFKEISGKLDTVDVLVNIAGLLVNKPFELMEEIDFNLMFDANVKSVFKLIKCLVPYFSSNAHIVNIGSMGGIQGSAKFPGLSLYSASKGAVAILTECLAEELKDRNISVNCLALGSVQTEMLENAFPGYKAPLSAAEMAAFIADFAMRGHKWFNGKVLPVAVSTP